MADSQGYLPRGNSSPRCINGVLVPSWPQTNNDETGLGLKRFVCKTGNVAGVATGHGDGTGMERLAVVVVVVPVDQGGKATDVADCSFIPSANKFEIGSWGSMNTFLDSS